MKIYGRSRFGFHGVVLDEEDKVLAECNHTHLTRTSAERCGKELAEEVRHAEDQPSGSSGNSGL